MQRKINLLELSLNGKVSSSILLGTENAQSDGVNAMFDDDPTLSTKFETDPFLFSGTGFTSIILTLDPPIQGNSFKLKTNIKGLNSGSAGSNGAIVLTPNYSTSGTNTTSLPRNGVPDDDTDHGTIEHNFNFNAFGGLSNFRLSLRSPGNGTDLEIINLELFQNVDEVLPFEFNDSVLDTHAWNSSRYSGKQLQGSTINEFNEGDISYANTPVVQNYSRNIYLGSRVIGMGEKFESTVDDTSLVTFPNFSYVVVREYLTVHDDLSVTRHKVVGDVPGKTPKVKKGWYRSFYDDFPIGSNVNLEFLDEKLETSLNAGYNVFFNGGQLQKLLHIRAASGSSNNSNFVTTYRTGSNEVEFLCSNGTGGNLGASFTIFNKENIIDTYFTGSLTSAILNVGKQTPDLGTAFDEGKI